ncbi:MAG: hypothetical protein WAK55_01590 [Xanthobacteraceae bacterium]
MLVLACAVEATESAIREGRINCQLLLKLAAAPLGPKQSAYNARMDRLNAIRLLKALIAAGAKPRAPMDSAWVDEIAVRDLSFHGTQLESALVYAKGIAWLVDSPRKGRVSLTRAGEVVARVKT